MAYGLDDFARDLAFEINLGGDRFDARDVAMVLTEIDRTSLGSFRERVKYHAEDFRPRSMDPVDAFPAWMDVELDRWLSGVRTSEDLGMKAPGLTFRTDRLRRDRDKWFLFRDGSLRKCGRATAKAAWGERGIEEGKPVEIPLADCLRKKADLLLDKFGTEVKRDCYWDVVEFSRGTLPSFDDTRFELMRNWSKIGDERVGDNGMYYIRQFTSGKEVLTGFDEMSPSLQEVYLNAFSEEMKLRSGKDLSVGEDSPALRSIRLDRPVSVVDRGDSKVYRMQFVSVGDDDQLWVSSQEDGAPAYARRLDSLSPFEVREVREATRSTLKEIMDRTPVPDIKSLIRRGSVKSNSVELK